MVPMFEALAEEHDLTLTLNVDAGCRWQEACTTQDSAEGAADVRGGPGRVVRRGR